jgi:hypothetical protein
MPTNKLNEDKFDEILRRSLRVPLQPGSSDFAERVLKQLKEAEEQRLLAKAVWQERLGLAGCIATAIAAIIAAVIFTTIDVGFTPAIQLFIYNIGLSIITFGSQWHIYAVLAGILVFASYSLVDLLVSD